MPFLQTRDVNLHYLFERNEDRPVLVLANSLGTNLSMWGPQASLFKEHFSLLRFDTRGHGLSSIPSDPFGIADIAHDVIALLDHLHLRRASFCGLSMGGMVGQWLAVHAAERFRCFVLCNTGIDLVTSQGMRAVVPSVLERWFTSEYREASPHVMERTAQMLLQTHRRGYALSCGAIRDMDFRKSAGTIHTPTLVVYGTKDPVTPAEEAQYLIEAIVNASALPLNAAHLSNIEAADAFSRGVLHFLFECYGEKLHG